MPKISRRQALKTGMFGAAGLAVSPAAAGWDSVTVQARRGLLFELFPHKLLPDVTFAYASEKNGDPFATLPVTSEGISTPEQGVDRPFSVTAKWFVEGFGNVWLEADNEGAFYTADDQGKGRVLNLSVEFASSRVARNRERMARLSKGHGTSFSTEVRHLHDLSSALLEDARKTTGPSAARLAHQSLLYSLWAGEKIELEQAAHATARLNAGRPFHFGCETRHFVWAKSEDVEKRFVELFNYATITHYVYDTWFEVFEPREGVYRWGIKDNIVDWLSEHDVTIEGRPLLWFHPWVTPDWLKEKSFDDLKRYVENHVKNLVSHYGDKVLHWEVVNEYHDWANIHRHTPEQITEITRLACEKTHEVNPKVNRIINNCCPFGAYASYGRDSAGPADRPLRTPRKFVQDLIEAEVPFETIGVQMYFPQRCLSDTIRLVEAFEEFGKPVLITEIGASSGPSKADILTGKASVPAAPYDWHRPWDDDLQADWLEETYRIFYSKPWIQGIAWYDFADIRTFIPSGGIVQEDGTPKPSFERLKALLDEWGRLPKPARTP